MKPVSIGIDLGTSGLKAILWNLDEGIIAHATESYGLSFPHPSWSEQSPTDWLEAMIRAIDRLLFDREVTVEGIGFSGQMHGLVLLDEADQVIRPAILWNDQRTGYECDYLNHTIGQDWISRHTANMALTGFTAPKLMWVKRHEPESFARIAKLMLPKDYLVYCLTGRHVTDHSDASGTLLYDVEHRVWSDDMIRLIDFPKAILPEVLESTAIVGPFKEFWKNRWTQVRSAVVVPGGADNAVAAVSAGVLGDNDALMSLGTSGVVYVASRSFQPVSENSLHCFCSCVGEYYYMGVMLSAAASLKWWVESILHSEDYDALLQEVDTESMDHSILFLPYLTGERSPVNDPTAEGVFYGLQMRHQRRDMTRAVLEGVAFALRDSLEIARKLGHDITKARIVGGGAKSAKWTQIIADVCNVSIETLENHPGPSLGAAMIAYCAVHSDSSLREVVRRSIQPSDVVQPRLTMTREYQIKYLRYGQLYPALSELR